MRMAIATENMKINTIDRIVEYATREQAQNAVNTLSNQNLMGRLVYVREVCYTMILGIYRGQGLIRCRIVRPSLVSSVVLPAATLAVAAAVASVVDLAAPPVVVVVAVNSMCRTFVVPNVPLVMLRYREPGPY